jgi:hypothetical protein
MAYRLSYSDYAPPAAPPAPPVPPSTPESIPGGPGFGGFPQPPDVPCDPTGDGWRGPPGPPGPPMGALTQDTPPANPVAGQLWFDTSNPQLYLWYVDPTSSQWVIATAYAGGLTSDAPSDGQVYGRQNGAWIGANSAAAGGPFLPMAGGTVSGPIVLPGNATLPLQAVPLQQVTAITGGPYLLLAGGNVSGATTFSATGTALTVSAGSSKLFVPGATSPVVVTANNAAAPPIQTSTLLQLNGADASFPRIAMDAFAGYPQLIMRASGGTAAIPTALVGAAGLGALTYAGYDGTGYTTVRASVVATADGAWASGSTPVRFVWNTTPVGGTSLSEVMRLTSAGYLLLGSPTLDVGSVLSINRNAYTVSGTVSTANMRSSIASVSGSAPALSLAFNGMRVDADTSTTVTNSLLNLQYTFGGATFTGGASGQTVSLTMNAASNPTNPSTVYYTASNVFATANSSAGGTNTTTGASGNLYGLNVTPQLTSGATNFMELTSAEIDSTIFTGASASRRTNLKLLLLGAHGVQGATHDSFLQFGKSRQATVGALVGLTFGTLEGVFPIDNTNGIGIGHTYGALAVANANPQLKTFIDASHIRALTAHWLSPGASVDGSGNRTIGPASLAWSSTGASLDVFGQTGGTPTVTAGGTGAVNGQIVTTGNGDLYTATASGGAITALTVIVAATSRTTGPTGSQTILGDGISGATCTIPWSNARALSLQPSGGTLGLLGATPVARQTLTGAKGGNTALASVIAALVAFGLATDTTTA